jgi:hypothetical protein
LGAFSFAAAVRLYLGQRNLLCCPGLHHNWASGTAGRGTAKLRAPEPFRILGVIERMISELEALE